MKRYIGVDLHKNSFMVCYFNPETGEKKFQNYQLKNLSKFIESLKWEDEVAVESTTNTRYFKKNIEKHVSKVVVIDTLKFKIISESVKKTDKNDAETIAVFLSKGMLPEVIMREEEISRIKSLANTRDKLVKLRTSLKNKIHNILRMNGIETEKEFLSTEKGLDKVLGYELSDTEMIEIKVCVNEIRNLTKNIEEIEKKLKEKGKNLKGFENLTSIKGIGEISATILLSVIGNINNFKNKKQLDSYFGIVPRVSNSNENVKHGRITKRGSKIGRTILVQCTLIAIKYSNYLRSYYTRMKAKKNSGKAIVATARKLLGIIFYTLKNNWIFEDFPNFVLKTI